jgi:hypothetical protein
MVLPRNMKKPDGFQESFMVEAHGSQSDASLTSWHESISSISSPTSPTRVLQSAWARTPPDRRGDLRKSRSLLVEMEVGIKSPTPRRGTLTFAKSVSELKRAGSSREMGPASPKPKLRSAPCRSQSCVTG